MADSIPLISLNESAKVALQIGYERALDEHERASIPVVLWRDGRVVEVAAADLAVDNVQVREKERLRR